MIRTFLSALQASHDTTPGSDDADQLVDSEHFSAFRTITTLLAILQQEPLELVDEDVNSNLDDQDLYELKVLDALATIMVINHEIIAVTVEPPNITTSFADRTLGLIAACHNSSQSSEPAPNTKLLDHIRRFLVSLNSSRHLPDQTAETNTRGAILRVEAPCGLQPGDLEGLMKYVEQDAHT